MSNTHVEKEAVTVEEALEAALAELGISREEAEVKVLSDGTKKIPGVLGTLKARVRVSRKARPAEGAAEPEPERPVPTRVRGPRPPRPEAEAAGEEEEAAPRPRAEAPRERAPRPEHRDEPRRDEPRRDEPRRDEPRRDEPRRDEPRRDEGRRERGPRPERGGRPEPGRSGEGRGREGGRGGRGDREGRGRDGGRGRDDRRGPPPREPRRAAPAPAAEGGGEFDEDPDDARFNRREPEPARPVRKPGVFDIEDELGEDGTPPPPPPPITGEDGERARELLQGLVEKMGMDGEARVVREDHDSVALDVSGEDGALLIGKHGATLDAVQYVLNRMAGKKYKGFKRIVVDAEQYRERREQTLRDMALDMADRVRRTRKAVTLKPMSAQERRIVHMALKDDRDVETRSVGQDEDRKLVISPRRR